MDRETVLKRRAARAAFDALLDYRYSGKDFASYPEYQLLAMAVMALQEIREGQEKLLEAINDLKDAVAAKRRR